jgi:hypothetical protein
MPFLPGGVDKRKMAIAALGNPVDHLDGVAKSAVVSVTQAPPVRVDQCPITPSATRAWHLQLLRPSISLPI